MPFREVYIYQTAIFFRILQAQLQAQLQAHLYFRPIFRLNPGVDVHLDHRAEIWAIYTYSQP